MAPAFTRVRFDSGSSPTLARFRSEPPQWLLIGNDAAELERVELEKIPIDDESVVTLVTPGPDDPALAALRSCLPAALGVLADPWDQRNCMALYSTRIPEREPGSLLQLTLTAARQANGIQWRTGVAVSAPRDAGFNRLPALVPGSAPPDHEELERAIAEAVRDLPATASRTEVTALAAGLLQIHDRLDASHSQSQSIEHAGRHRAGDYWHAIMHRREPDYGNAKYWFRHVGRHPIFSQLAEVAMAILAECAVARASDWLQRLTPGGEWDPLAFVDMCAECARQETAPLAIAARRIQEAEMRLLLLQTWRDTGA